MAATEATSSDFEEAFGGPGKYAQRVGAISRLADHLKPLGTKFYHGEKVAFGTLCLLMLEGRALAEIEATAGFCHALGLSTTLADLKLAGATASDIGHVAEASLAPGSATWRAAAPLSVETVRDAIFALDAHTSNLGSYARI